MEEIKVEEYKQEPIEREYFTNQNGRVVERYDVDQTEDDE